MGALGQLGRRLVETVEDRVGQQLVPRDRVQLLESAEGENRALRKTLEFIGFRLFNQPGMNSPWQMPRDVDLRSRIASAKEAHRAWQEDPQAGQHVDLYNSFVFGRGVPQAQAADDDVQELLDETWRDLENERTLTSYEEVVALGTDLCIQSTVPFVFHDDGQDGQVRVSTPEFEDVLDVVRHPRQYKRVLYYKVRERQITYDFREGRPVEASDPKVVYYEAYGAFDEDSPVHRVADDGLDLRPPAEMLRPGKMFLLTVNRTSKMAFGVPRMRRLIRWFTAYNELIDATVEKMKAAAKLYMKATVRGNENDLTRLAQTMTSRRSLFAAGQEQTPAHVQPGQGGTSGSALLGNDAVSWEPLKIDTGSGDLQSAAPTLRGQTSGQWPGSYLNGQAESLAGATAMELPALKFVEGEQELWRRPFRVLADLRIRAAIRAGLLSEWRDPTELEAEQIAAAQAEGRPVDGIDFDETTGLVRRDLSFTISMPNPLERAMTDVIASVTDLASAIDPNGENPEVSRWMFEWALKEAFGVEEPRRIVDQVLPRRPAVAIAAEQAAASGGGQREADGVEPGAIGADGRRHPAENPYGAKQRAGRPEDRQAVREAAVIPLRARRRQQRRDEAWRNDVESVVRNHLARLDQARGAEVG